MTDRRGRSNGAGPASSPPRVRTWTDGSKGRDAERPDIAGSPVSMGSFVPGAIIEGAKHRLRALRIYTRIYTRATYRTPLPLPLHGRGV